MSWTLSLSVVCFILFLLQQNSTLPDPFLVSYPVAVWSSSGGGGVEGELKKAEPENAAGNEKK